MDKQINESQLAIVTLIRPV